MATSTIKQSAAKEVILSSKITQNAGTINDYVGIKNGNIVNIRAIINGVTLSNGGQICVIDRNYAPVFEQYVSICNYSTGKPLSGNAFVNSAGSIRYFGSDVSNVDVEIFGTYIV